MVFVGANAEKTKTKKRAESTIIKRLGINPPGIDQSIAGFFNTRIVSQSTSKMGFRDSGICRVIKKHWNSRTRAKNPTDVTFYHPVRPGIIFNDY
jgi:hypothetical protein